MLVLGRRRVNGRVLGVTGIAGLPPGQVKALAAGAPTVSTIPVTYTAPTTGAAPITYSGMIAPHASSSFVTNAGTFTAAGGTFTGLSAGTSYDIQIIATNSAGSSITSLLTGISTAAATTPHYTAYTSQGTGPTGTVFQYVQVPPSGGWPSGTTVSITISGGTTPNASLPASGTSAISFPITVTGAAGTNCIVNSSASGLVYDSGAEQFAIVALYSGVANRFDALFAVSATTAGTPQTLSFVPNGTWPSSAGSITAAVFKGAGTFPDGPTANYTPGSATAVTIRYTPSAAGEHAITTTNTASLYKPYPAPLNVFASVSGAAQTLSASLYFGEAAPHQRDTVSGNPSGFSFSWARGWGEVPINITAIGGTTAGLWVKLYDAMSAGATTTRGTGTALNSTPVQVYGAIGGTGTIRLLLPAGPYLYFAELATDAAFTNPVRIANRFQVGMVMGVNTRSFECGIMQVYADTINPNSALTCRTTVTNGGYDYRYGFVSGTWFVNDGTSVDPEQYHYGNLSSAAAMEAGRMVASQFGVTLGIIGIGSHGGGVDEFVNNDGSLTGCFTAAISGGVGGKFRYLWIAWNSWDGTDNTNYPTESLAEYRNRFKAAPVWITNNYPACAVIGITSTSGLYGDGSRPLSYFRTGTNIILNEIEPVMPNVVSKENYSWNEYPAGHASQAARQDYAYSGMRLIFSAETASMGGLQTTNRGPTIASSATIASGSRVIRVPYKLNGGTALVGKVTSCADPVLTYLSATSTNLCSLFGVYIQGGYNSASGNLGKAVKITNVAINTVSPPSGFAGTLDITLAGSSGITYVDGTTDVFPSGFTINYGIDLGQSGGDLTGNTAAVLCDDRSDFGIGRGWHMRPKADIPVTVQ